MLSNLFPNVKAEDMIEATYETMYMTILSLIGVAVIRRIIRPIAILNEQEWNMGK